MRFWHFGSSLHLFFTLLLLLGIGVVMMYEPRFLGDDLESRNKNVAYMELDRFSYYEVSAQGVLSHATGERGYRFPREDIIKGLNLAQFLPKERKIERLSADLGIKRGKMLIFPEGVKYTRESSFSTQKGEYDLAKRYFKGEGEFEFIHTNHRAQGKNIRYDSESGIVRAQEVKAVFLFQNGGE
ncbi:MAG: LPS export ABC transporter periplasmic protein LptC [Wolinella sp.]